LQLKNKRKNGGGNKVRWSYHGDTMQKGEIFVTGGVFLLDIGLLMGAIGLKIPIIYTSLRRYDNFEE
jgi:hypothetical protein